MQAHVIMSSLLWSRDIITRVLGHPYMPRHSHCWYQCHNNNIIIIIIKLCQALAINGSSCVFEK